MQPSSLGRRLSIALAILVAGSTGASAQARLGEGFEYRAEAQAPVEEIAVQPELWVMQVDLKPMRMITVEITDPKTGERSRELVWYLTYRAVNRPLDRREAADAVPVNELDPPVAPPMFVPEFELVVQDRNQRITYPDQVIPEALAAIVRRERRDYRHSVGVVGPVPPPVEGEPSPDEYFYGVAMWRGIDPDVNRFSVYGAGFSNGYRLTEGPDGQPLTQEKTLMQAYWRPGDRYDQFEREVRVEGLPTWIYR